MCVRRKTKNATCFQLKKCCVMTMKTVYVFVILAVFALLWDTRNEVIKVRDTSGIYNTESSLPSFSFFRDTAFFSGNISKFTFSEKFLTICFQNMIQVPYGTKFLRFLVFWGGRGDDFRSFLHDPQKKSSPPNFHRKYVFRENLSTVEINALNGKHEYTLKRKWKKRLVRVRIELTTLALSAPRSAD